MTSSTTAQTSAPGNAPISQSRRAAQARLAAPIAAVALAIIALLAFSGATEPTLADRLTLLFLGLVALVCAFSPARHFFNERRDAATFALAVSFFIIYSLARRAGPSEGWELNFAILPDDSFRISWAARAALLGAFLSVAMARYQMSSFARALLGAALLIGALSLGTFLFLSRFYTVGSTEILDPKPLADVLLQCVEYGAVGVLCAVVGADDRMRPLVMKILPFLLLALWAKHQFGAAPVEEDEE
ncbi:MAG TPA: hypothetical protein VF719_02285 [Abditibacteriaceae bacterium]|jgi:hypothetical protein